MTETEKLRELVTRLERVRIMQTHEYPDQLVALVNAQAVFALEEQLGRGSAVEEKLDALRARVEKLGKVITDMAAVVVDIGRSL